MPEGSPLNSIFWFFSSDLSALKVRILLFSVTKTSSPVFEIVVASFAFPALSGALYGELDLACFAAGKVELVYWTDLCHSIKITLEFLSAVDRIPISFHIFAARTSKATRGHRVDPENFVVLAMYVPIFFRGPHSLQPESISMSIFLIPLAMIFASRKEFASLFRIVWSKQSQPRHFRFRFSQSGAFILSLFFRFDRDCYNSW